LWVLRELGTHLYAVTDRPIGRNGERAEYAWTVVRSIARTFDRCRFYTWDGTRLREHRDADTATDAVRELAGV
jgi:hypothetical protein